jgi:3-phytase
VYRREGEPGRPHDHSHEVLVFTGGAAATDGVDVTASSLGPEFPDGLMVAMNSAGHNFLLFRWGHIAAAATPPLRSSSTPTPVR